MKDVYPRNKTSIEEFQQKKSLLPTSQRFSSKVMSFLKYLGPAFIVSIAYIDPGNFATNISGGSIFNYTLLWVILWSNLMAIFLQSMSAKLGIATGKTLPQMCKLAFSKPTNRILWLVAVLAVMATDLAEFLGGTLGFYLLFRIPMVYAAILTAIATFIILYLEKYGQRIIEIIIALFISVISIAYILEMTWAKPEWHQVALHTLVPSLPNGQAVLIAAGMLGATVMPHVIYLHSHLVQSRHVATCMKEKKWHLKMEKLDIFIAMNIALIVNASMVIVSASVFHRNGIIVNTIEQAHYTLAPLVGNFSSFAFGIALLASGLSSSAVGTLAGETVMNGFIDIKLPNHLIRAITMAPALIIIFIGINPMQALLLSQVLLSFALPLAIIPMILITNQKKWMGDFSNTTTVKIIAWLISFIIISLNLVLLFLTFSGSL